MLLSVPMRTVKTMVASSSTRVLQGPPQLETFLQEELPQQEVSLHDGVGDKRRIYLRG